MNGKTDGAPHEQTRGCERASDLVAFLYGEAGPAEARDFRLHLNACDECREELAAFGEVRARVVGWRAEALGDAPALGLSRAFEAEPGAASSSFAPAPRARSARAALREFFALSPWWLRAATTAALLVFCGLAALALGRAEVSWNADGFAVRAGAPERVITRIERVEVPAPGGLSGEQVEALVRARVRDELAAERRREEEANAETADLPKPAPRLEPAASTPPRRRAAPRSIPRGRRPAEDDESLPRLSDLLNGVY